jgi:hypothetical protein
LFGRLGGPLGTRPAVGGVGSKAVVPPFAGRPRRSLASGTILEQGPMIRIMSVHRFSFTFGIRQTAGRRRGCRSGWNLGRDGTLNMRNRAQAEGCA